MSFEQKFFVGQDVFIDGHNVLRPAKIARITPKGRIRIEGSDTDYGPDGYHKPKNGWAADAVWLVPSTPELIAKHRTEVRRNAVASRVRTLYGVCLDKVCEGDLEHAFRLITEAINILNNSKETADAP